MPGLLTPDRRQRQKNRSRAATGTNKQVLDEKIKLSKPKRSSQQSVGSNDSISYDSFNSIVDTRTVSPIPHASSPRKQSSGRYHDESTADITDLSSLGSPASFSRGRGVSYGSTPNKTPMKDYSYDEEMPDDEMMDAKMTPTKSQMVTPTKEIQNTNAKVVSPDSATKKKKKSKIIKSDPNLSREEHMEQKVTALNIAVEKQKYKDGASLSVQVQLIESLKEELAAKDKLLKQQEESHQSEVLAIQRVLADVTTEKLKLEGVDVSDIKPDQSQKIEKLQTELKAAKQETVSARLEAEKHSAQVKALEINLSKAREDTKTSMQEVENLQNQLELETMKSVGKDGAAMEKLEDEISHQKLETEKLKVDKMEIQVALASAQEDARKQKADNEAAQEKLKELQEERNQAVKEAEASNEKAKLAEETIAKLKEEKELALKEMEELRKSKEHAMSEVDKVISQAKAIKAEHPPSNSTEIDSDAATEAKKESSVSDEEFLKLQKTLAETVSSLETSKKICASLESANGSLALESRSKLKEKEEELAIVQKESEDRKRNLDSLATELRDLQRKQGDIENADRRTKVQLIRQKALMDHLESTLNDLQEAVIVHESSANMESSSNSSLEEISEILGDALHAITATLETSEEFVEDVVDGNSDGEYGEMNFDTMSHSSRNSMKNELDQKKVAVKRLEEALKKQNEEIKRMRSQFYNSDNSQMRTEIQRLRQQCTTNMEVLAKKERELSVLKASLKVDENESGYISDDASDDEDEEAGDVGAMMSAAKLGGYGPADAEAYATILSQANGRIGMPAAAQVQEIEALKRDLMEALGEKESASKELQARRESLANAKMIISSLEQANKGMMADLRSRLQDSNTAISSLLNKSKQHETAAEQLRKQMQQLEQERQEERSKYEAELQRLRNEMSLDEKKDDSS